MLPKTNLIKSSSKAKKLSLNKVTLSSKTPKVLLLLKLFHTCFVLCRPIQRGEVPLGSSYTSNQITVFTNSQVCTVFFVKVPVMCLSGRDSHWQGF